MLRKRSRSTGFTLPELLCTIGVVAVMVAWILPAVPVEELQLAEMVDDRPVVMRCYSVTSSRDVHPQRALEAALPPALRNSVSIASADRLERGRYHVAVWHPDNISGDEMARHLSAGGKLGTVEHVPW